MLARRALDAGCLIALDSDAHATDEWMFAETAIAHARLAGIPAEPYNDMHGYETETHIGRYIGKMQWLMPFIGFDWRYRKMGIDEQEENLFGQVNKKDNRTAVSLGFMYTLPMLVNFQAEVYHDGIVRLSLMREDIPITKRIRAGFMVNTDKEFMVDLRYIINRNMGIRTHYDSDMGFGVGLTLNY